VLFSAVKGSRRNSKIQIEGGYMKKNKIIKYIRLVPQKKTTEIENAFRQCKQWADEAMGNIVKKDY
jgi:hypothetical protein